MMRKRNVNNLVFRLTILIAALALPASIFGSALQYRSASAWQIQSGASVVRLHVRAAGDSPEEQGFKFAIASQARRLLSEKTPPGVDDYQAYLKFLQGYLPELESSLQNYAAEFAAETQIAAQLVREDFPLRTYGRRIYPAGNYTALTITIGEGAGENWWCLLFPPLCLPPATIESGPVEREKNENYNEDEEGFISTAIERPSDFDLADVTGEKRSAILSWWRSKIWELLKQPGQHLIEKAERIFYN